MKTYTITITKTIEAKNENQALELFNDAISNGDYSPEIVQALPSNKITSFSDCIAHFIGEYLSDYPEGIIDFEKFIQNEFIELYDNDEITSCENYEYYNAEHIKDLILNSAKSLARSLNIPFDLENGNISRPAIK